MEGISESGTGPRTFLWTRGVATQQVLYYLGRNGIDAEPLPEPVPVLALARTTRVGVSADWSRARRGNSGRRCTKGRVTG
jgi:hypothetical protein